MSVTYVIITLIIMTLGLLGTVLPMLPGIVLIYGGFLFYGIMTDWSIYGWRAMLFWGLVTMATFVVDYLASALGARKFGASRYGFWGSLVGGFAGIMVANLPGLIVGAFAGAFLAELLAGKQVVEALRSGQGALIGLLAGTLFKVVLGIVMIGSFIWWVLK
jgi:uncharacterized protein YqgC (DUF456 family)